MAGLRTRVTIFRGAGPTYCARSETSCARTLTVRRQNRCCASSQMRTDAERMPKKYPNPKQKTWKHLSLDASCTSTCAGAYAESSKSGPIARTCKSSAPSLATRTRICSGSSWIRAFPQPTTPQKGGLREIVIHRKIRGSIRSEDTMEWLGYLFTCITTWKMRGLDPLKEMAAYI